MAISTQPFFLIMAPSSEVTAEVPTGSIITPNPPTSTSTSRASFAIGTRRSDLALWQTNHARDLLLAAHPTLAFPVHAMATRGDKNQTTALHAFAAKSLWTQELEEGLLSHALDLLVHSLKDMPTQLEGGCALAAACARQERRDCVVMSAASAARGWCSLADLPEGSAVGTSSVRRAAQLRRLFPQLRVVDMRGNVGTRLGKLDAAGGDCAALILAATGLQRIGFGDRVSSFLSRREGSWLGAVGQGALGVEVREGDQETGRVVAGLVEGDGRWTWWECLAERMLLRALEGGCSVPIGVETEWVEPGTLAIWATVVSVDGSRAVEGEGQWEVASVEQAEQAGLSMAKQLVEKGAEHILKDILLNRKIIEDAGGA